MSRATASQNENRLYRSRHGMFFGVCEGFAEHFDLNPWGVRLVWVLLTVLGAPFTIIGYFGFAMALKRRPGDNSRKAVREYDCASSRETLQRVTDRFARLDQRLQRMESIVTRPAYELERSYRDL